MAFTYTPGATADADRVRFELGDTNSSRALFDDAEIADLLAQESDNVLAAAAHGCEILAVRFARDYDFSADGSSFKKGSVSGMYAKRARSLRSRGPTTVIAPRRVDGYSQTIDSDEVTATRNGELWRQGWS